MRKTGRKAMKYIKLILCLNFSLILVRNGKEKSQRSTWNYPLH